MKTEAEAEEKLEMNINDDKRKSPEDGGESSSDDEVSVISQIIDGKEIVENPEENSAESKEKENTPKEKAELSEIWSKAQRRQNAKKEKDWKEKLEWKRILPLEETEGLLRSDLLYFHIEFIEEQQKKDKLQEKKKE